MQNAFGNVNVDGQAAAHGQRIRGREIHIGAVDLRRCLLIMRAVDARERRARRFPEAPGGNFT